MGRRTLHDVNYATVFRGGYAAPPRSKRPPAASRGQGSGPGRCLPQWIRRPLLIGPSCTAGLTRQCQVRRNVRKASSLMTVLEMDPRRRNGTPIRGYVPPTRFVKCVCPRQGSTIKTGSRCDLRHSPVRRSDLTPFSGRGGDRLVACLARPQPPVAAIRRCQSRAQDLPRVPVCPRSQAHQPRGGQRSAS